MLIKTPLMNAREGFPSESDVESCLTFFKCDETSGTIITDSKSGVVYTPSVLTFPLANAVRPDDSLFQGVLGSFNSFWTNPILSVICCQIVDITALRATTGDTTIAGIGISNLTRAHAAIKGVTVGFGANEFADVQIIGNVGEDVFLAIQYNPGVSCTVDMYKKDGTLLTNEVSTTAAVVANLGAVSPTSHMRMSGADFYGFAQFSVSSIPNDFLLACHEMLYFWSAGLKNLPERTLWWD